MSVHVSTAIALFLVNGYKVFGFTEHFFDTLMFFKLTIDTCIASNIRVLRVVVFLLVRCQNAIILWDWIT